MLLGVPAALLAQAAPNRWALVKSPAKGSASSLGEYSSGCLRGAAKLALDGTGYQVMHPSRLRYYGNPDLVDFLRKLGQGVHAEKLADLMVGDLSQPRGGPAPGGHSSHQTGLDVDLWYWQPKAAARGPLSLADRENTKARSVLDGKAGTVRAEFAPRVAALLRLTASDTRVTRIFVHPIIKRMLCADAESDRAWLSKVGLGTDTTITFTCAWPAQRATINACRKLRSRRVTAVPSSTGGSARIAKKTATRAKQPTSLK